MEVIKYNFSLEEEVLMHQLDLDRFLLVVTWVVNNLEVMAQVIEGITLDTFETRSMERKSIFFQNKWKVQMQSMFYHTPHQYNINAT